MASEPTASVTPLPGANATGSAQAKREVTYESLGIARVVLVLVYVIVAVWYLAWRPTTFNPQAMASR